MSKKKKQGAAPSGYQAPAAAKGPVSDYLLLGGCLLLTFMVFANTFSAGFVNWDDHGYLWLNPLVQPPGKMDLGAIFTSHTHGNYSPLVVLSYCLEHGFDKILKPGQMEVENFQPFLYHFDNVLLHLGATALAFFFLRALGLRGWGLAFGTALFGIHPMRAESVAWVTERKDVLYGLFYIAALLNYWKYLTENKGKYFAWTLVFGLLSLFSKIQAVSLPLSMLALDWLAGRQLLSMKVWMEKAPFFLLSLVFGLAGIKFLNEAEGFKDTGYSMVERFFFAAASLCNYLWKLPVPTGLAAYYPYPAVGKMPALYYAAPLALILIGWWVWGSMKKGKTLAFGMAFFLVNIMFVLQFKGAGKAFMADRFTYIPYLGLFYVLAKTYSDIESGAIKSGLKSVLPYLAAAYIGVCAVLTFMQNNTWKSSVALWENAGAKNPNDALSWSNLGLAHDDLNEHDKALKAYEHAIKVDPAYFDAHFNTGVALNKLKRYDEAVKAFEQASQIKPDYADTWYARAQVWMNKNEFGKAIADFEKAKQMGSKEPPDRVEASLASAYAGAGQHEQAVSLYDSAIKLRDNPDYQFKKGNSLAALGRMDAAIACYDAALALSPTYAEAVNNKGNAYASMGKFADAIAAFDKALQLKPDASNFRFNRGMAKNGAGDRAGACADWQQAAMGGYGPAQTILQQLCK